MKSKIYKLALPIGLGLTLLIITIFGIISTSLVGCKKDSSCPSKECKGDDGKCYSCSASGTYCSTTHSSNCGGSNHGIYCCTSGPADPPGTITTNFSSWVSLYDGPPSIPDNPSVTNIKLLIAFDASTLNTTVDIILTNNNGEWHPGVCSDDIAVCDIGSVEGLGDVTSKPSSGYISKCLITLGHGYVVKYKHSHCQTTDNTYYYARFYAYQWIEDTGGGIMGVDVKFQNPF